MTPKLYGKALATTLLATTLSIVGLAQGARANPYQSLNGLNSQDLVSGQHAGAHIAPLPATSSDTVSQMVERSVTTQISPASSLPVNLVAPLATSETSTSVVAQATPDVAQSGVTPVDETFSPLTDSEIRELLLIDPNFVPEAPRSSPGSSFLVPSAYGADWGDAFVGLSGVTAGNRTDLDGSASLGLGFGDAVDNIGLEVSVGIISLNGFADDGIVGFKLHKVFPEANNLAVALGWSNAAKWGDARNSPDTFYGVVTQRFDLDPGEVNPIPLTVSLGAGTGSFRSRGALVAGNNDLNIFGSVGVRVIPELSVISSWNGSSVGVAASAAPFDIPLVVTAGFSDVTGSTVAGTRFNASLGYSFSF